MTDNQDTPNPSARQPLKPCPSLCGGRIITLKDGYRDAGYATRCVGCGWRGPIKPTDFEAIAAWNRRARAEDAT